MFVGHKHRKHRELFAYWLKNCEGRENFSAKVFWSDDAACSRSKVFVSHLLPPPARNRSWCSCRHCCVVRWFIVLQLESPEEQEEAGERQGEEWLVADWWDSSHKQIGEGVGCCELLMGWATPIAFLFSSLFFYYNFSFSFSCQQNPAACATLEAI